MVCDSISTFITFTREECQQTFKIQKGPSNCDSEKVLYLLKWKACGEVLYVNIQELGSAIIKVNIEHLEKVIKKFLRNVFTLTIVSMATVELMIGYLNNVKHMNSQKKWNLFPFGNTDFK